MAARLNARLDRELDQKLGYLKLRTKLSVTEIVKRSIERYYSEVKSQGGNARVLLTDSGFVGCSEGEADLSSRYKQILADSFGKKS
jgi:hypothetical protein